MASNDKRSSGGLVDEMMSSDSDAPLAKKLKKDEKLKPSAPFGKPKITGPSSTCAPTPTSSVASYDAWDDIDDDDFPLVMRPSEEIRAHLRKLDQEINSFQNCTDYHKKKFEEFKIAGAALEEKKKKLMEELKACTK